MSKKAIGTGRKIPILKIAAGGTNPNKIGSGLWSHIRHAHIDGRTKLAHIMNEIRRELFNCLGHEPSYDERLLIDHIARKEVKSLLYDLGLFKDKTLDSKDYSIALDNSLRRDYAQLGLKRREVKKPDAFDEWLKKEES